MELAELIIHIAELIGTIAFAVSGVIVAIEKQLDFFGAMVLGVTTAVGGGALRDVLLGITPPTMFQNYVVVAVAVATSGLVFMIEYSSRGLLNKQKNNYLQVINIFDAVGLGVFTVIGVNTAIMNSYSDNWFLAIFIGTITGIGGGVLRDVLAGRIPLVLYKEVYALAAISGASLFYILHQTGLNLTLAMLFGASAVMLIRLLAIYFKWSLPKVPQ